MKIAVSACLLGQDCKYSGGNNLEPRLTELLKGHEVIPVCPEVAGGLPVPRTPAEIRDGRVINRNGEDVDEAFRRGAQRELERVRDCDLAILQPRSPSCGVHQVYDGSFTGARIPGQGVFAGLLMDAGIRVAEPWEVLEKKDIRLVAVDMDGTLLDSRKQQPPEFIPWVKAHPEIRVVAASGRQIANLVRLFPGLEDQLVFMSDNGALIMQHDEILYSNVMRPEDVLRSLQVVSELPGAVPCLCGIRSAYTVAASEDAMREMSLYYAKLRHVPCLEDVLQEDGIVKIAICFTNRDAAAHIGTLKERITGRIAPVLSGVCWCDIANADVNKGHALRMLMEKLDIPPEKCMAFGDYLNDLEMLQAVGESYAMANALPEIRQAARHMTASNDRRGVMRILETLDSREVPEVGL